MAYLFSELAPDARTPADLAEAIDRMLNYLYAPPIRGVKRELASLPKVYALALTVAKRFKAADPKLPPLPARESNAHVGLRQLRTWCAAAAKAPAPPPGPLDANPPAAGFLGVADLARAYKVPEKNMNTLHKRLQQFRKQPGDDVRYVLPVVPGSRQAHYLHAVEHVLPLIKDLIRL